MMFVMYSVTSCTTGARITGNAAHVLRRESERYALATQCIGGGQRIGTVPEPL